MTPFERFLLVLLAVIALSILMAGLTATARSDTPATVAAPEPPAPKSEAAKQTSLAPADLAELSAQPAAVQALFADALALTGQGLVYRYGSADPANGGMDCSGTIHYVLARQGVPDVPRQANEFYVWVRKAGLFQAVVSNRPDSFEFDALRPGDLLFWTGTYAVERDPPVTHVMLYLGRETRTGKRVMFGASAGRRYGNDPRDGVSVFDFTLPGAGDKSRFIGYAPVPGLVPTTTPMEQATKPIPSAPPHPNP